MPGPKKDDKRFTTNEVAVLVESFKNDIHTIAEDLSSVREDISTLKEGMAEVKNDLTTIKDAVKVAIPEINKRVATLEAKAR